MDNENEGEEIARKFSSGEPYGTYHTHDGMASFDVNTGERVPVGREWMDPKYMENVGGAARCIVCRKVFKVPDMRSHVPRTCSSGCRVIDALNRERRREARAKERRKERWHMAGTVLLVVGYWGSALFIIWRAMTWLKRVNDLLDKVGV